MLEKLLLPRRWEHLSRQAADAHVDPLDLVERVEPAEERVSALLSRLLSGAGGVFEIFFGLSGSGKTTFVKSLPRFFANIQVVAFGQDQDLAELPQVVARHVANSSSENTVVVIQDRDNPEDEEWQDPKRYLRRWLISFGRLRETS